MTTESNVATPSLDYEAMAPYWKKVSTVLAGTDAMRETPEFLPQLPNENDADYKFRRTNAKFTNVFGDILETLSAKPFSKEVQARLNNEDPPEWAADFSEDVDARGNHLHVFASPLFYNGVADAISWTLVDYTKDVSTNASRAEEKQAGARPYWVRIAANDMIAVESAIIKGKEEFTHVRFRENKIERIGYKETLIERIRVFNREALENGG